MKFLSLEPFIPSGKSFAESRELFQELGFRINWDAGDYAGFQKDGCKFIRQNFDNPGFAQNLMVSVRIDDAEAFWNQAREKKLQERFGIRLGQPTIQPYGKEVNLIDMAGVCWHFVE